jgi:hypothetical protein
MALAPTTALGNLGPLVFGHHALELEQEPLFGSVGGRGLEEHQLDAGASELFGQDHLIGIATTQTIGGIDQHGADGTLVGQIPEGLQGGAGQSGTAIAFVLKLPLGRHLISVGLSELDQGRGLTVDGVIFLLTIGGDARVEGRGLGHGSSPGKQRGAGVFPAPRVDRFAAV